MWSRIVPIVLLALLVAAPFALRPDDPPPPPDARTLVVVSPHNEQIRTEFAAAFDRWHRERFGERVHVAWSVPGGTSEIRKMLQSETVAAIESGRTPGGSADLVFGGGSYEHSVLARGVTARDPSGRETTLAITEPVALEPALLEAAYGDGMIADVPLYDPEGYWHGTALSGFGIVYNRDVLAELGVPEPASWTDLGDPRLDGWVALVNPGQSGSITTAFEAILQRRGWDTGWKILRRAAANARYFSASSLRPPGDVARGAAAMGVCIDFYGRYQAQAIREAGGGDRVGYVDPAYETSIDPDPVSMLRNPPDRELAVRFIEFTLSTEGQALWQFRAGDEDVVGGEAADDDLGPRDFELRRLPVRPDMYERFADRMIDDVNPYEIARPLEDPASGVRTFIAPVFAAMAMDVHEDLQAAWRRITSHPAYPRDAAGRGLVTAADVDDPDLKAMLEAFDAMPEVPASGDRRLSIAGTEHLVELRSGWLRDPDWEDEGLWPREAEPGDVLRREMAAFFRERYRSIADR